LQRGRLALGCQLQWQIALLNRQLEQDADPPPFPVAERRPDCCPDNYAGTLDIAGPHYLAVFQGWRYEKSAQLFIGVNVF
jgi:hypothetical protein